MSVYTRVGPEQLERFLSGYAVGELEHYAGISAGITNTNYFVDTTQGHWVLTLFERMPSDELPFFMHLMDHLAGLGLPCAHPVARREGGFLSTLAGKPAALVYRLRGASMIEPSTTQCAALGATVAELHRAAESFKRTRRNGRGLDWAQATRDELSAKLPVDQLTLLDEELTFQASQNHNALPQGIIHADLFRDNVLFDDDHVSGLIDFYYACSDALLFDLAVICNDWCLDEQGNLFDTHWQTLSSAYNRRRAYSEAERDAWPGMLRAAALRFWVSRLYDWHFPTDGDVTHTKDPEPFARILVRHRDDPPALTP